MPPQLQPPHPSRASLRGGSLLRLRGLLRKESYQILRDPSSLAIAFVLPLVLLLIFGYGISLDAEHVPIALVVESPSADTASFTSGFRQSRYFEPVSMRSMGDAEQALDGAPRDGHRASAIGFRPADARTRRRAHPSHRQRRRRQHGPPRFSATCRGSGRNGSSTRHKLGARRWPCRCSSISGSGSIANCAAATSWCPA